MTAQEVDEGVHVFIRGKLGMLEQPEGPKE